MDSGRYNRHFKRRVVRQWNKIKIGRPCTKFVERNGLYSIPHGMYFQAVKIGDDLMCVYNVGIFELKDGFGFVELATVCHLANSLFGNLGSLELGYFSEEELEKGEEIQL